MPKVLALALLASGWISTAFSNSTWWSQYASWEAAKLWSWYVYIYILCSCEFYHYIRLCQRWLYHICSILYRIIVYSVCIYIYIISLSIRAANWTLALGYSEEIDSVIPAEMRPCKGRSGLERKKALKKQGYLRGCFHNQVKGWRIALSNWSFPSGDTWEYHPSAWTL